MSSTIEVERTETQVPLDLVVTKSSGGVTGLTPVVQIRDGNTSNSFLDFNDNTFKAAGWVTKTAPLTEVGSGFYRSSLDLTAITNLPASTHYLSAEFIINEPAAKGSALTQILMTLGAYDRGGESLGTSTITGAGTTTVINTGFTEPAGRWTGNFVKVVDGSDVSVRQIEDYAGGGVFTVYPPFPFAPSVGSSVEILADYDPTFGAGGAS